MRTTPVRLPTQEQLNNAVRFYVGEYKEIEAEAEEQAAPPLSGAEIPADKVRSQAETEWIAQPSFADLDRDGRRALQWTARAIVSRHFRTKADIEAFGTAPQRWIYETVIDEKTRPFSRVLNGKILTAEQIARLDNGQLPNALTTCGGWCSRSHWHAVRSDVVETRGTAATEADIEQANAAGREPWWEWASEGVRPIQNSEIRPMDELDKIQKLAAMRDAGLVSAEEYQDAKRKLLASMVEGDRPRPRPVFEAPVPIANAPDASAARRGVEGLGAPVPRTFVESVQVCLSKYADFSGRASRSEFWWFGFFLVLLAVLLTVATVRFDAFWLLPVAQLALALPGLAVGARRLHDVGRSGWWQAGFSVPAGVASVIAMANSRSNQLAGIAAMCVIAALLMLLVLVVWWAGRGQHGNNEYGTY